jgi:tetratricopeptide (TPR) repeat protein
MVSARLATLEVIELHASSGICVLSEREAVALAYVCAQPNQRATRRALVGLLWPNIDERRARHSLSQLLYELRRRCPGIPAIVDGEVISAAAIEWDVAELYTRIDKGDYAGAIDLYRGAFLAGCTLGGRVADWRDEVEGKVAAVVAGAMHEEVFTCDSVSLSKLGPCAEQLADRNPHLILAQLAAIQASVRMGNTVHARHLHERYATFQAGTLPPFDQFNKRTEHTPTQRPSLFVGRTTELAELNSIWRAAQNGLGQVAILLGEAGIGKTSLAEHFLKRVAVSGGKLWIVSCCAATQRLPYSVARDLYRDNVDSVHSDTRACVERAFESVELFGASAPDEVRHRLTEAFTSAAAATAKIAPLVIFVDDAQWADQYTALLLSYWAHRMKEAPIFILLAVRTQEADYYPEWLVADLARVTRIELHHLSIDSATDLVRSFERVNGVSLDPVQRDGLLWLSGGRPFLLLEALATSLHDDVDSGTLPSRMLTPTAESVLKRRFRGLPQVANAVAEFLAVWGKPLAPSLIAKAASLNEAETADALDTLHSRGIISITSRQIIFVHELMRETAFRLLPPGRRALTHRKAAEFASLNDEPNGFVAEQFAAAGESVQAAQYALAAAHDALAAQSYSDYEYYLRLAHTNGDEHVRQTAAGDLAVHLVSVGRIEEVREFYSSIGVTHPCSPLLSVALEMDGLSKGGTAVDQIGRASQLIPHTETQDPLGVFSIVSSLFDVALDASSPGFMKELMVLLKRIGSTSASADVTRQLAAYEAIWHVRNAGIADARLRAQEVVTNLTESDRPSTRALCRYTLGTLLLLEGRVTAAIDEFDQALKDAEVAGDIRRQHAIHINRGVALVDMGDTADACESLGIALASPHLHVRIRSYTNLAIAHYEAGRLDLAGDAAATVITMNQAYQSQALGLQAHAILGLIAIDNSDMAGISVARRFSQSTESAGNVFEDSSYVTVLRAKLELLEGNFDHAVSIITKEASRLATYNALASLRMRCALAEMLAGADPYQAHSVAMAVQRDAAALNAKQLAKRVSRYIAARC